MSLANEHLQEEERIREAYQRRSQTDPRYSFFDPANLFILQDREAKILRCLKRSFSNRLDNLSILEVGCGSGRVLLEFIRWGANPSKISGVDLLEDRLREARRTLPKDVRLYCQSADDLPFQDEALDLVFQSTAFTSILNSELKRGIAKEMLRVLRPSGIVLWYDFAWNNPKNSDVRGIGLSEIRSLFPGTTIESQRLTLAPPIARVAAHIPFVLPALNVIPLLRSHLLVTIKKTEPK